jgi:flagellar motor switch protein FliN/FliY
MAGEPVDLLVNGAPIARGEVVVIDEQFGLRVTEMLGDRSSEQSAAAPLPAVAEATEGGD